MRTASFLATACSGFLLFAVALRAPAQSNLVYNGSFELNFTEGWSHVETNFDIGGFINERGAAEGRNWVTIGGPYPEGTGSLWQDLHTVPGRSYRLGFAMGGTWGQSPRVNTLRVWWNETIVDTLTYDTAVSYSWLHTNYPLTALSNITRLRFENLSGYAAHSAIDAISAGWVSEPPSIIVEPPSRSTFTGGAVSFAVTCGGVPPLNYQWYLGNQLVANATNRTLTLTNVQPADAGDYTLIVTNSFGSAQSFPATLVVHDIPESPLILSQPKSQSAIAGYFVGFHVVAVGTPPLAYQWRFNNSDLDGATNASLAINATALEQAGLYSVIVSNQFGTTLSLAATLDLLNGTGGGAVWFANRISGTLDAPVFDVDGITRIAGSNFVAQLYCGVTSNILHGVGEPIAFRSGLAAGYFYPAMRFIPDVLSGSKAYVQVRVWEKNRGQTFEEAQALGGRFGKSDILTVTAGDMLTLPAELTGLWNFNLQAGQPLFASAKFRVGERLPDGSQQWFLIGDPGWRYLLEQKIPPADWLSLFVLTNTLGTVSFVDPDPHSAPLKLYRARILDQ